MIRSASAALSMMLLSGCAVFQGGPAIEKRFASYGGAAETDSNKLVTFSVTASDIDDPASSVAITALSDRGQAALIEQLKGKPPVALKPDKDRGGSATVLRNSFKRRLTVSIQPVDFLSPGDRIDAIKVSLRVDPTQENAWLFTSWSFASNGQKVIDIGKLTAFTSNKITGSTGLGLGPTFPNATVGFESSQANTREVAVKDTTDFDAGVTRDGEAWLYETAGWRDNLAHNLTVDAVVTAQGDLAPVTIISVSGLASKDEATKGQPAKPSEVSLTPQAVYVPINDWMKPVCGTATLTYRVRHITNAEGVATTSEGDDVVRFSTAKVPAAFLLSPAPYTPLFVLYAGRDVLHLKLPNSKVTILNFGSIEDATAFRDWFRTMKPADGKVGNPQIGQAQIGFRVDDMTIRPLSSSQLAMIIPSVSNPERIRDIAIADARACRVPPAEPAKTPLPENPQ